MSTETPSTQKSEQDEAYDVAMKLYIRLKDNIKRVKEDVEEPSFRWIKDAEKCDEIMKEYEKMPEFVQKPFNDQVSQYLMQIAQMGLTYRTTLEVAIPRLEKVIEKVDEKNKELIIALSQIYFHQSTSPQVKKILQKQQDGKKLNKFEEKTLQDEDSSFKGKIALCANLTKLDEATITAFISAEKYLEDFITALNGDKWVSKKEFQETFNRTLYLFK